MAATHTLAAIGVTFANGKHMLTLFNGAGSNRVLRLYRVCILNNQTAAVSGVLTTLNLRRVSVASGGTAVAPTKHDTNSPNLVAQVLAASGASANNTSDPPFRSIVWSNDEPTAGTGTSDEMECMVPLNMIWDSTGDANVEPIVLRPGEGVTLQHTGTSAVGVCDIFFEFTDSAT